MSVLARWRDWNRRCVEAVKSGQPVPVIGGSIVVGSRVKHMNQGFGDVDGTATVTGFEVIDDSWVKILVKEERPGDSTFLSSGASKWDFDRTEKRG